MRKLMLIPVFIVLAGLVSPVTRAQTRPLTDGTYGAYLIKSLPRQSLSEEEIRDLTHMREEEKLARDVYLTLSRYYSLPVFKNIARSENQHTKMIKLLLDKYSLPDPVSETGGKIGVFKDPDLQKLYNRLVSRGKRSLVDALQVGATIEDLDIKDLEDAISRTDNRDVRFVYQNLMKGSQNHMRAFVRLLRRFGSDYTPRYISQEEFNRILAVKGRGKSDFRRNRNSISSCCRKLEGRVVKVSKERGFGRRNISWWVVWIESNGTTLPVRVAPVWWLPRLDLKPGDRVEVTGFRPPYWNIRGIEGYMACKLTDKTAGKTYDFSRWRRWCRNLKGATE